MADTLGRSYVISQTAHTYPFSMTITGGHRSIFRQGTPTSRLVRTGHGRCDGLFIRDHESQYVRTNGSPLDRKKGFTSSWAAGLTPIASQLTKGNAKRFCAGGLFQKRMLVWIRTE